jgi:SAM-dependent methyltransferase
MLPLNGGASPRGVPRSSMNRTERERRAYDEDALWERSHRAHMRFRQVFECPNSRRADRLFDELLQDAVAGRRVLEVGCAEGARCRAVLRLGAAYVLGVDVSERFLAEARAHAVPGRLEFAHHDIAHGIEGRFDVIVGSAILHHLDYRPVLMRLYEDNLAPGGLMLFREPLGGNLLIRLWWRLGADAHSPDERPLYPADLAWLRARFPGLRIHGVNYLSLPAGIASSLVGARPDNLVLRWCDRADHWLDTHCRWLVPRFRYSVLAIHKPAAPATGERTSGGSPGR